MSDNLFAACRKVSVGMWAYCFFDRYDKILAWHLIFEKSFKGFSKNELERRAVLMDGARAERTHSRLRHARLEAARTGHELNRRGASVGLAERSERSQPHALASAA